MERERGGGGGGPTLCTELSGAWTSDPSGIIPLVKAPLTFSERGQRKKKRRGMKDRKKREKKGKGRSLGSHLLTKHSAWDMAFTENSQMPRQLIRVLNASCINTPCSRP